MAPPNPEFDPSRSDPPPREVAGLRDSLRAVMGEVLHQVQLRCALVGLEASQVAGHLGRLALALLVVVTGGALAYLAGLAALVVWAAERWTDGSLAVPLAVAAAVHALGAAAAAWWLIARGRRHSFFPATRAEFQEDRQWLTRENP